MPIDLKPAGAAEGQPMPIEIKPADPASLRQYGAIPIAFEVRSILQLHLVEGGPGGLTLREVALPEPYLKDYDALPGGHPESWPAQFDLANWAVLLAGDHNGPLAGAVVNYDTPGLLLPSRRDLAVLWDIRVHPRARGRGLGTQLFLEACHWARARGCTHLLAETQNTNLPACRFYARMGCELRAIDRLAYAGEPQVAHEIMLLWQKTLA